jgi:iron complex transport system ATP-binding protein
MIEARDVKVSVGGRTILHGIDFAARAGKVTAIVGPNGSGKSTLLKALSGDLPASGEILLAGRDLNSMKSWQTAGLRAVLPQHTTLSFPYTVREIVRLGLMGGRSGVAAHEVETLPERALAKVDLAGFAGRFYQELSGGEQQRVQLARVLCQVWVPVVEGVPRFLFLDEPVSSLDVKHQLVIMDIARDYARRGGGVIAILHDLNLTAMYADEVAMLHEGRVVSCGTPAAVLTDLTIERVFDCRLCVGRTPPPGMPFVLPQSASL